MLRFGIQECRESADDLATVLAEPLAETQHLQRMALLVQPQALQFLPLPLPRRLSAGLEGRRLVAVGHWLKKLAVQALDSAA